MKQNQSFFKETGTKRGVPAFLRGLVTAAALTAALVFGFTACGGDDDNGTKDAVVDILDLTTEVTAPVKDAAPDTTAIDTAQYTGTVEWKDGADAAVSGNFAASTVYKALVTLAAKSGYTFAGVAANSFTCTGATVTNAADSGTVTITFPATAAPGQSAAPTATVTTVAKTTAAQAAVDFTLTNSAALSGAWKVYAGASGDTLASGVTAAVTTWPTLRLSHATDIPAAAYYVSVTETGKTESARLALTVANPVLGGAVSITGTAAVGEVLTADTTNLDGSGTISYQWKIADSAAGTYSGIASATAQTYTVVTADVGKYLKVAVTRAGYTGSVESAATRPASDAAATTANLASVIAGLAPNTADTPYTISLAEGTSISDNWTTINTAVASTQAGGKYVVLDLSACSMRDSELGNNFNIIKDNAYITGVIMPDALTHIGESTFYNCSHLTSIIIGDNVINIWQSAFEGTSITSVDIPDGVTIIGIAAFRNCAGLTSVTIPAQVTSIGGNEFYGTFDGCTSLTRVTFEGNTAVVKTASEFPSCGSLLTAGGATAGESGTPMAAGTYTLSGTAWTKSGS